MKHPERETQPGDAVRQAGATEAKANFLSQAEIDAHMRGRIEARLSAVIADYDGSPMAAKEILRGLVAARAMGVELGPFEDALAERHRALGTA